MPDDDDDETQTMADDDDDETQTMAAQTMAAQGSIITHNLSHDKYKHKQTDTVLDT